MKPILSCITLMLANTCPFLCAANAQDPSLPAAYSEIRGWESSEAWVQRPQWDQNLKGGKLKMRWVNSIGQKPAPLGSRISENTTG
jgi:hypothetical protein